jgi:hypothetical protein
MKYGIRCVGLLVIGVSWAGACAKAVSVENDSPTSNILATASGAGGGGGQGGASEGVGGHVASSTAMSSSSSGPPGSCVKQADCAALVDACHVGNCVNGMCEQVAANDGSACDDGLYCTDNDACQSGTCVGGTQKFCPSPDSCHVGSCDEATKACGSAPGNDGASCDDGDPCTYSGTCSQGTCSKGASVDCSAFNGTCSDGVCDPVLGCIAKPKNDGAPCDDGLYCTVQDACKAGACTGVPNTCSDPVNAACMIASCNEAQKSCVAVPGNDGKACDDGNPCTVSETCSSGNCLGGVPGNNGSTCDDKDACTSGTMCSNGVCGNPQSQVVQCINGDQCCPAGCGLNDNDCVNLNGVFAQYNSESRNVYIWKTPVPCADLSQYTTFCQDRGLTWWAPKSQPDAQQLISFAYNLDQTHTWIQTYNSVVTNAQASTVGAYNVTVDSPGCVEGSASGWTAFRKWGCSYCDPESNAQQNDGNQSCCWDKGHPYDWFVCQD